MLIDITTPSFSFLPMVSAQMMNQGNRASEMSAAPEYAITALVHWSEAFSL